MKIEEQTLGIDQMEKLRSLGNDTSDASLVVIYKDEDENELEYDSDILEDDDGQLYYQDYFGGKHRVYACYHDAENGDYDHAYKKSNGVYTLQEVLDKLPKVIEINGVKYKLGSDFSHMMSYHDDNNNVLKESNIVRLRLIDAACELLYWVLKNVISKN